MEQEEDVCQMEQEEDVSWTEQEEDACQKILMEK